MTTSKVSITIEIDQDALSGYTDSWLALAWHTAQANPAPHADKTASELVERIGREIIRRWLGGISPELWRHQGSHYPHKWLTKFARYEPGGPSGTPEWGAGVWVAREANDQASASPIEQAEAASPSNDRPDGVA